MITLMSTLLCKSNSISIGIIVAAVMSSDVQGWGWGWQWGPRGQGWHQCQHCCMRVMALSLSLLLCCWAHKGKGEGDNEGQEDKRDDRWWPQCCCLRATASSHTCSWCVLLLLLCFSHIIFHLQFISIALKNWAVFTSSSTCTLMSRHYQYPNVVSILALCVTDDGLTMLDSAAHYHNI